MFKTTQLTDSKVDLVFHPFKVYEMSTRYSWGINWHVASKLSPLSGSVALGQLNPIRDHNVFFLKKFF